MKAISQGMRLLSDVVILFRRVFKTFVITSSILHWISDGTRRMLQFVDATSRKTKFSNVKHDEPVQSAAVILGVSCAALTSLYIVCSLKEVGCARILSIVNYALSVAGCTLWLLPIFWLLVLKECPIDNRNMARILVAVVVGSVAVAGQIILTIRFVREKVSILSAPDDILSILLALPAVIIMSLVLGFLIIDPTVCVFVYMSKCSILEIDDEHDGCNSRRARLKPLTSKEELISELSKTELGQNLLTLVEQCRDTPRWTTLVTNICCASGKTNSESRPYVLSAEETLRNMIRLCNRKTLGKKGIKEGNGSMSRARGADGDTIEERGAQEAGSISHESTDVEIGLSSCETLSDSRGSLSVFSDAVEKNLQASYDSILDRALAVAEVIEQETDSDKPNPINEDTLEFAVVKRMLLQEELCALREKIQKGLLFHRGKTYAVSPKRALFARLYLALVVAAAVIALATFAAKGKLSYTTFKEIVFWVTFALVTVFGVLSILTNESDYFYNLLQGIREIRDGEELFSLGPVNKAEMQAVLYESRGFIPWMKAVNNSYSPVKATGVIEVDLEATWALLKAVGLVRSGEVVWRPGGEGKCRVTLETNARRPVGSIWRFEESEGDAGAMRRVKILKTATGGS